MPTNKSKWVVLIGALLAATMPWLKQSSICMEL
jgi:hypothetical protein